MIAQVTEGVHAHPSSERSQESNGNADIRGEEADMTTQEQ